MLEFGAFSEMHEAQHVQYSNDTFIPECASGLYCATFVKDDAGSEHLAKVLNMTFKRILRTKWTEVKPGKRSTRFCVYRVKEKGEE